jgi:hypothetical protein
LGGLNCGCFIWRDNIKTLQNTSKHFPVERLCALECGYFVSISNILGKLWTSVPGLPIEQWNEVSNNVMQGVMQGAENMKGGEFAWKGRQDVCKQPVPTDFSTKDSEISSSSPLPFPPNQTA